VQGCFNSSRQAFFIPQGTKGPWKSKREVPSVGQLLSALCSSVALVKKGKEKSKRKRRKILRELVRKDMVVGEWLEVESGFPLQ